MNKENFPPSKGDAPFSGEDSVRSVPKSTSMKAAHKSTLLQFLENDLFGTALKATSSGDKPEAKCYRDSPVTKKEKVFKENLVTDETVNFKDFNSISDDITVAVEHSVNIYTVDVDGEETVRDGQTVNDIDHTIEDDICTVDDDDPTVDDEHTIDDDDHADDDDHTANSITVGNHKVNRKHTKKCFFTFEGRGCASSTIIAVRPGKRG
ncbi:hypothetical protein NDU88_002208 [Pleurodeles waltl]|uniref:Uncharacterized protein n=1 Tax=Pleurodeles waltl TaxID=8319 RepID=A0AAV7UZ57_PLEWA|nr:hypothetical protein NDU88_002208 [Pleurodeles waltl]